MPLPTFAGTPTLDQLAGAAPPSPAAGAPLGFLDRLKLGFKQDQAAPDWGFNQVNWESSAINEVAKALRQKGIDPVIRDREDEDVVRKFPYQPGAPPPMERAYKALFDQVHQVQLTDPNFLPDYAPVIDRTSLDMLVADRRKQQLGQVEAQAPDGIGVAGMAGGFGHRLLDPINYLPIGGEATEAASVGGRILRNGIRWGAINMGITGATEPLVRQDAQRLGIDRTNTDFVTDLLGAGAGGFVIGGPLAEAGRFATSKLGEVLKRPDATAPQGEVPVNSDAHVAQVFQQAVPPEERTPDEQAAVHAVNRDAEVKATSPFVPGPEGDDTHAQWLDQAMRTLNNPEEAPQRGPVKPIARETIQGPDDVAGTRDPARETVKALIHRAEGDGKNRAGGAAMGPYQFEPSTWISLFRRRYPGDPRSNAEIAGLREDPHLNDVLINDLMSENSAALRHAGFEETPGNLYLAHVLGHDRAVTVLRANPDAKLGELLPANYFKRNPFRPDDSAGSLVHWAYGKMGDKNALPLHFDSPEGVQAAATGAEAINAGEGDPEVQMSTGRFDAEALYGDVGMTDRPVLKPEQFDSPEEHAAAQVRFERIRDASDGYAPVMSRAEAFSPVEHFDALRRYQGKVTPEAIGEALGLNPDEVRRAVASMQSVDPNSPFVLSRGRQPKFDDMGNVVQAGTEPGRIIRRPPNPRLNRVESMLEYLTRARGLKDNSGDLASMGGNDWHKEAPFRRKLIDNENGQPLDDAFTSAIEAGYFPTRSTGSAPDIQDFYDAIDDELRGKPRYIPEDYAAVEHRRAAENVDPEAEAAAQAHEKSAAGRAERLFELTGHNHEAMMEAVSRRGVVLTDDELVTDMSDLIDRGLSPDDALDEAVMASAARELDKYAAMSGEMGYGVGDEWLAHIEGTREIRDGEPLDPQDELGGGRSEAATGGAEASRDALAQSAHDPAAGQFSDPIGPAAEAQADSLVHDLEMQGGGEEVDAAAKFDQDPVTAIADLPEEAFKELGTELGVRRKFIDMRIATRFLDNKSIQEVRDAFLRIAEKRGEAEQVAYRLDEEGGEADLKSILDEIDEAQKATDAMRACLKPKGGDE